MEPSELFLSFHHRFDITPASRDRDSGSSNRNPYIGHDLNLSRATTTTSSWFAMCLSQGISAVTFYVRLTPFSSTEVRVSARIQTLHPGVTTNTSLQVVVRLEAGGRPCIPGRTSQFLSNASVPASNTNGSALVYHREFHARVRPGMALVESIPLAMVSPRRTMFWGQGYPTTSSSFAIKDLSTRTNRSSKTFLRRPPPRTEPPDHVISVS